MSTATHVGTEVKIQLAKYKHKTANNNTRQGKTVGQKIYGRLYAQLNQPPKVRFEINAFKVYGLL